MCAEPVKLHVYNPIAVEGVMRRGVFESYWSATSSYDSISYLINNDFDGLKGAVLEMLAGGAVRMKTTSYQNDMVSFRNKDDVLTALIHLGYLAYLSAMQYYFKPIREFPSGRGFADVVFIPKTEYAEEMPALLVELKWNRSADTAIRQIKEKKYTKALENYKGDLLLVGVNYHQKRAEHQCRIEKFKL